MGKTMRKLRRAASFVLALAMMVIMTAGTAFAAEAGDTVTAPTTLNISVKNNEKGNTFTVYKVMAAEEAGKAEDGETTLYKYTLNPAFEGFFKEGAYGYVLTGNNEIQKADKNVESDSRWLNDNATEAAALAAALENYAVANNVAAAGTLTDTSAKPFAIGYYVVAETESAEEAGKTGPKEVASKPILVNLVEKDAEITAKNDTVTLEKNIVAENGEDITPTKKNDVNIGDTIGYKIETKLPTYEANIGDKYGDDNSLKFVLTDTFSEGLTYQDDLSIDGFTKDKDYTVSYAKGVLTITFENDTIVANQGKAVVATYSAVLNENAKVLEEGNPNDIKLEYTNNTNEKDGVKYLEDETITYTYGFGIHKVDGTDGSDLENAMFTVSKNPAGADKDSDDAIKFVKDGNTYTVATEEQIKDSAVVKVTEIVSVKGEAPVVKGLDAGDYYLKETKAPDSYTKLTQPVKVTITEVKGSDDKPTGEATLAIGEGQGAQVEDKEGNKTGSAELKGTTIELNVRVENTKGITLPETGRNTALFCMIAGAAVVALGLAYLAKSARRKA